MTIMINELLEEIGLSELQAQVYMYLLEKGPTSPPALTKALKITRTNAYKVLDQLFEYRLVKRSEIQKKLIYQAEDPIALSSLVAQERNRVLALEKNTKAALKQLRLAYQKHNVVTDVQTYQGSEAVKSLFVHQASIKEPIYFIKCRADILALGYDTMGHLRHLGDKFGTKRYGVTPDVPEAPIQDVAKNEPHLDRTWLPAEDYIAPVEWTASGDELLIINYEDPIFSIRIKNRLVAEAFKEVWKILDKNLKSNPNYKTHPIHANRKV
jgi:predicted transcriptional regulator